MISTKDNNLNMQKCVWVRLQSDKHQKTILDNKGKVIVGFPWISFFLFNRAHLQCDWLSIGSKGNIIYY